MSETVTPVAESGPLSVTTTVNLTVVPTLGFSLSTDLSTTRSTSCEVVALAVLLSSLSSYWSPEIVAVFSMSSMLSTLATRVSVADAPLASEPIAQVCVSAW